jgi:hypothetical protein
MYLKHLPQIPDVLRRQFTYRVALAVVEESPWRSLRTRPLLEGHRDGRGCQAADRRIAPFSQPARRPPRALRFSQPLGRPASHAETCAELAHHRCITRGELGE